MADNFIFLPGRTSTQYVTRTVHEHRAPTDASVALLKEMEEAAEKKRTSAIRLEGNGFNCLVQIFRRVEDYSVEAVAIFDLNGVRKRVSHWVSEDTEREDLLNGLRGKVAEVLATEMIMQGVK